MLTNPFVITYLSCVVLNIFMQPMIWDFGLYFDEWPFWKYTTRKNIVLYVAAVVAGPYSLIMGVIHKATD